MIVKDEAHIIEETLNSVLPYIDYWVICDTGSVDNTVNVIKSFFKKHDNLNGELYHHDWKNFGENRSRALDEAYILRDAHKCEYILMFDSDDIIHGIITFPMDMYEDAYNLQFGSSISYARLCLFKCSLETQWGYKGVLHEFPYCYQKEDPITGIIQGNYYVESRRLGTRSLNINKYVDDARMLMRALESETETILKLRYTFYAGQSYFDGELYDLALVQYKRRLQMGGWMDEVFISALRIAIIMEQSPSVFTIAMIKSAYLRAFYIDMERAEPLYYLSRYLRVKEMFEEAYMFGKLAQSIPWPKTYKLFNFNDMYAYMIDDEVAISAYNIGKKKECLYLCDKLLLKNVLPQNDRARIEKNRQCCL